MTNRFLCVHGHFYQPPREDPWSGIQEAEPSAAPYHNWNERIYNECYGPMASSAILGPGGQVAQLVNNYRDVSFNFGPTLMTWLERRHPETYQAILEADALSVNEHGGHGNAISQGYNHVILPLASERDRRTQVRWGLREFESRFGRRSEGMWLPETAVDSATLETLIDEGVRFTILSPLQAARVKAAGTAGWENVDGDSLDSTQAYLWRSKRDPSKSIALFFYHRKLSQGVAFERMLNDGAQFNQKIDGAFSAGGRTQLVHLATDGESYGHHHQFGNMALAFTLNKIKNEKQIKITNYGEFLSFQPPTAEVEIFEPSAWSCAHGVGRWSADCGCASGANASWKQPWRAPLRSALDWLAAELDAFYEEQAKKFTPDPWAARDAAIDAFLDPAKESASNRFLHSLNDMQRERQFMYTSCGWFFDDVSGIESQIILRHAARAIELARALGHEGAGLERSFIERLARCPSNITEQKDGARVYEKLVLPQRSRPIVATAEASERDALQQRIYYQLKAFVASPSIASLKSVTGLLESASRAKTLLHWWEYQRVLFDWIKAPDSSYQRLPADLREECAALTKLVNLESPSTAAAT